MMIVSQVHLIKKIREYFENFFNRLKKNFLIIFFKHCTIKFYNIFFVKIGLPIEEKICFFDFQFYPHNSDTNFFHI